MNVQLLFTKINASQAPLIAQDILVDSTFFVTILAGVILALAFQFILTAISVAGGVSAMGNIKENYVSSKIRPGDSSDANDQEFDQDYSSGTSTGVKITSAFGIWSLITTCLALFGATALALNLNVIESEWINITTSLVIWGLFFLILFYLEAKIARTLIGNLISAATSGLRSSANMIGSIFTPSSEKKIEKVVGNTVARIRKEFDSGLNADKLSEVLDKFLTRVDNKIPDYENLKSDLEGIAKKSSTKNTAGKWMAVQQVLTKLISENNDSGDNEKKGKAKKLKEILDTVVSKYNERSGTVEGVKNVLVEFTSLEREQINKKLEAAKSYLASSSSDGLSLENIQMKFKEILNDPNVVTSMISDNFKSFDKEHLIDLLDKNTKLEKEQLESYADRINSTVQRMAKEFDKENENRLVKRMEGRVSNFFENTGRNELDYSILKNDVKRMLDNPKDSLDIIKRRFDTFDSNTLRAVVTNNKYIQEENIDSILEAMESGKRDVMDKVSKIETTANQQIEMVKRKAVIQAEHARATAASAAWWLVITTILSGVAAIAGGMVTL
ncbi:MAG: hypothetical protein WBB27_03235 [Maribacter sp.]